MYDEFSVHHKISMSTGDAPLFDQAEIGRALGHDLFKFGRPLDHSTMNVAVFEGFAQAQGQHVRRQASDRFTRKWLQLRLNAYIRRRHVDVNVTPELLKSIDVTECPILRIPLTHGELLESDWSVDRLHNDGAYAASNLAVMSVAANRAKGSLSFEEVLALSNPATVESRCHALEHAQWLRLAALMLGPCFAMHPQLAPTIPLVAPIPKFTVRETMQLVQYVFTTMAKRPAGKNVLIKMFTLATNHARCKAQLNFLAEAVHAGLKIVDVRWDVWLNVTLMERLVEWRNSLDDIAWGKAGEIARSLVGGKRVNTSRLDAWHLESRGYTR